MWLLLLAVQRCGTGQGGWDWSRLVGSACGGSTSRPRRRYCRRHRDQGSAEYCGRHRRQAGAFGAFGAFGGSERRIQASKSRSARCWQAVWQHSLTGLAPWVPTLWLYLTIVPQNCTSTLYLTTVLYCTAGR